jgi:hypothetical protein
MAPGDACNNPTPSKYREFGILVVRNILKGFAIKKNTVPDGVLEI